MYFDRPHYSNRKILTKSPCSTHYYLQVLQVFYIVLTFTNLIIAVFQKSVDDAKKQKSGVLQLFANRGNIKALTISCAMVMWQQLSGINVVLMYGQKIFEATGVKIDPSVSTIIVGSVMLLASGVTPSLAKITTMRMLLYVSAIGMAVTNVRTHHCVIISRHGRNRAFERILRFQINDLI